MPRTGSLSDIRNYLYDQVELRWWWVLGVTLVAQLLSLIAIIVNQAWFLVIVGFVALITPIAVTWLRESAIDITQKADKCRRLILYADGLGTNIPESELATVRSWTTGIQLTQAPFVPPYYASTLPNGPQRLVDITAESAYFTRSLAGKAAGYLLGILGVSIVIVIAIIYFADFAASTAQLTANQNIILLKSAAKVAVTAISFILSGEILILWKQYSDLKSAAGETFRTCAALRDEQNLPIHEAMQVVEDYHLALLKSPPIPAKLYLKYQDELNQDYRDSYGINPEQP